MERKCSTSRGSVLALMVSTLLFISGQYAYFLSIQPIPVSRSRLSAVLTLEGCEVPLGGFKAWNKGVVTLVRPVTQRNCSKVILGNEVEIEQIRAQHWKWKNNLTEEGLLHMTSHCLWVADYFQNNLYITKLERSFPVAYSFVVYDSPQQVVRLLRLLYRPTNTYCLHPDRHSTPTFSNIIYNIAKCLENVVIPSRVVSVSRGPYSLMEAQVACLEELTLLRTMQSEENKWRYVINLCGKELPIASTHEIASVLTRYNGSSLVKAHKIPLRGRETVKRLNGNKELPYDLQLYKSRAYMALSYTFVQFLLTSSVGIRLQEFFKTCQVPEEYFYATLYMSPGAPGGFNPKVPPWKQITVSNSFWVTDIRINGGSLDCTGNDAHNVCIVTSAELKEVLQVSNYGSEVLFHDKYLMEEDHTVMDCMEEWLVAMNWKQFKEDCLQRSFLL